MHSERKLWSEERGFTMLEILLTIILFSSAIVVSVELFLALTARITVLSREERNAQGPQHVVSAFSSALNRATHCAVYPDRAAFEQGPSLGGTLGNFGVIWIEDGTTLAFELAGSELRMLQNPGTPAAKERLWATGIEALEGLCCLKDGALVLNFSAEAGTAKTTFTSRARVASAR